MEAEVNSNQMEVQSLPQFKQLLKSYFTDNRLFMSQNCEYFINSMSHIIAKAVMKECFKDKVGGIERIQDVMEAMSKSEDLPEEVIYEDCEKLGDAFIDAMSKTNPNSLWIWEINH